MSNQNPLASEGDPPIIVQGGSSVNIVVPPNFNQQTGDSKDFKNDNVNLISLQIDGGTPIPLNKNAKITITYK
ncbi:MAG TPA: hypothetical protein VD835_03250 [Pyrinomonadaceae bacterium]|nr:hypothetical protein [Pyrinomonadaceae bacterium]